MANQSAVGPASDVDASDPVVRACENEWNGHKGDCSGFVRAVAKDLDIVLIGQANELVESMTSTAGWVNLGQNSSQAISYAKNGYLVIAGLAAPGHHGHVAVVIRANSSVPIAYWGKLHSVGRKRTSIHWAWNATDLPNVGYFAHAVTTGQ